MISILPSGTKSKLTSSMRINVNLVSNVLDTPEIFWSEPALEPLYRAIRGYLEISQRLAATLI